MTKYLPFCRIQVKLGNRSGEVDMDIRNDISVSVTNYFKHVLGGRLALEDEMAIGSFIHSWAMSMVNNHIHNEIDIEDGKWEEYQIVFKMPRYSGEAIMVVS